jgi:hypothetical protein
MHMAWHMIVNGDLRQPCVKMWNNGIDRLDNPFTESEPIFQNLLYNIFLLLGLT